MANSIAVSLFYLFIISTWLPHDSEVDESVSRLSCGFRSENNFASSFAFSSGSDHHSVDLAIPSGK
jgi:hypothetical protein